MTVRRQKSYEIVGLAAVLGLLCACVLVSSTQPSRSALTERTVAGRFSALAIGGYDPVGYFTNNQPVPGDPGIEALKGGAVWRFQNDSNRAFFLSRPDVYGPAFGGYDPIDVARGVAVAGDPRLWLIVDQRLYLFAREETRAAFAADPAWLGRAAAVRWPTLVQTLAQ